MKIGESRERWAGREMGNLHKDVFLGLESFQKYTEGSFSKK